jgi:hypothetical protein
MTRRQRFKLAGEVLILGAHPSVTDDRHIHAPIFASNFYKL